MLPWEEIRTVLLDMDGTLLDLHFDNHFWLEHVPLRYAEARGVDLATAKRELYGRYERVKGTMDWYCLDYWSGQLDLDVAALKQEVEHLIAVHPHVPEFLEAVAGAGKRVALVTNAHLRSLALKMDRTRLAHRFHAVISAHELGLPKEDPAFWGRLTGREPFEPGRTLLVDDSLSVLRSAARFGIAHLRAVARPDSRAPAVAAGDFAAIRDFRELMPPG